MTKKDLNEVFWPTVPPDASPLVIGIFAVGYAIGAIASVPVIGAMGLLAFEKAKEKMDPNTPISFNTCNYRTYLLKVGDTYD